MGRSRARFREEKNEEGGDWSEERASDWSQELDALDWGERDGGELSYFYDF